MNPHEIWTALILGIKIGFIVTGILIPVVAYVLLTLSIIAFLSNCKTHRHLKNPFSKKTQQQIRISSEDEPPYNRC